MQKTELKVRECAKNALAAFCQALRLHAAAAAPVLPRLLALLAHDAAHDRDRPDSAPPALSAVRDEVVAGGVPAAVFLPYLSHLIEALLRGEREVAKRLLGVVAAKFPQAVYLPMRTSLLHLRACVTSWLREEDRRTAAATAASTASGEAAPAGDSAAAPAPAGGANGTAAASGRRGMTKCNHLLEVCAFEFGKELLDAVRAKHVIVASNLERFVVEVGTKFNARPEERLLNVVHSLLQRCYRLPLRADAGVPDTMKDELRNVCEACLSQEMQARHPAALLHFGLLMRAAR